jgi:hypothetical protein
MHAVTRLASGIGMRELWSRPTRRNFSLHSRVSNCKIPGYNLKELFP